VVVGVGAGDLIGVLSLAITHDIGLAKFSSTIFPYPTRVEVLRKLGDAWRRGGLTPVAKTALSAWFRLRS
jgi:pyruvate/2-oxoglutarate dehydrogenase complex dihydrolipoamide dehydrogenase (E3) component